MSGDPYSANNANGTAGVSAGEGIGGGVGGLEGLAEKEMELDPLRMTDGLWAFESVEQARVDFDAWRDSTQDNKNMIRGALTMVEAQAGAWQNLFDSLLGLSSKVVKGVKGMEGAGGGAGGSGGTSVSASSSASASSASFARMSSMSSSTRASSSSSSIASKGSKGSSRSSKGNGGNGGKGGKRGIGGDEREPRVARFHLKGTTLQRAISCTFRYSWQEAEELQTMVEGVIQQVTTPLREQRALLKALFHNLDSTRTRLAQELHHAKTMHGRAYVEEKRRKETGRTGRTEQNREKRAGVHRREENRTEQREEGGRYIEENRREQNREKRAGVHRREENLVMREHVVCAVFCIRCAMCRNTY